MAQVGKLALTEMDLLPCRVFPRLAMCSVPVLILSPHEPGLYINGIC